MVCQDFYEFLRTMKKVIKTATYLSINRYKLFDIYINVGIFGLVRFSSSLVEAALWRRGHCSFDSRMVTPVIVALLGTLPLPNPAIPYVSDRCTALMILPVVSLQAVCSFVRDRRCFSVGSCIA
jgi:hypothetical protein